MSDPKRFEHLERGRCGTAWGTVTRMTVPSLLSSTAMEPPWRSTIR